MDLDATVKGINITVEDVEKVIASIISVQLEDGVEFRIKSVSQIMDEAEYPSVRISMEALFDRVRTPLKIDISTGDVITPSEMRYRFKLMLEDRFIDIYAYNLETVLAEKLETIISRNVANTRMRDFYDIHILQQIHALDIDAVVFRDALAATSKKRGTQEMLKDAFAILDDVEKTPAMGQLWKNYQKSFTYARDIDWKTVINSVRFLLRLGS